MTQFMERDEKRFQENQVKFKVQDMKIQNQGASLQSLERQDGDIAELLRSRKEGGLPSSTETNP